MVDLFIFISKYSFLIFIYLFLFWLLRLVAKDLRRGGGQAAARRAALIVEESPGLKESVSIPLISEVSIGRHSQNTLVLKDESVSAFHARVFRESNRYVIEDLGSTNGTFVNNSRLTGKQTLASGNKIKIGRSRLVFRES